jgi:DNA-binding CsgD family transcriptional regulator
VAVLNVNGAPSTVLPVEPDRPDGPLRRPTVFLAEQLARSGRGHAALRVLDEMDADSAPSARLAAYRALVMCEYPGERGVPVVDPEAWSAAPDDDPIVAAGDLVAGILGGVPAEPLASRAEWVLSRLDFTPQVAPAGIAAVRALTAADRLTSARDWALELARRSGAAAAPAAQAEFLALLARCEYRLGDLTAARAYADAALTLMASGAFYLPRLYTELVRAKICRFNLDADQATAGDSPIPPPQTSMLWAYHINARGHGRMAQGNIEAALADFTMCGRVMRRWGADWPTVVPWRSSAALACLALGGRRDAVALVTAEVERARALGAPCTLGISLRRAAAVVDAPQRGALLTESADLHRAAGARLELARTLLATATDRDTAGDREGARTALAEAAEVVAGCGALAVEHGIAAMSAHLGRAVGVVRAARRRDWNALTGSQAAVLRLVVAGRSNRQIAEELSVSLSTVKQHLTEVYRKLGRRTRRDLILRARDWAGGADPISIDRREE